MSVDLARDALVWRTDRFVLRPLDDDDAQALLAHLGDPQVTAFLDIAPLANRVEALDVIAWAAERRAAGAGVRWSIRPAGGGGLIGTCGYNQIQRERSRQGEVAYDVSPSHWGRRVMDEILPSLVAFGFDGLALGRITALVTQGNDPSCRLLERHGFLCEGLLRANGHWKGRYWDQFLYARIAEAAPAH